LARPASSPDAVNCASVSEITPLVTAIVEISLSEPRLTNAALVRSPPVSLTAIDNVGVPP
jgi:hypothetical protein